MRGKIGKFILKKIPISGEKYRKHVKNSPSATVHGLQPDIWCEPHVCLWTSNTRSKMFTLHSINAFGQVTQEVFYPPLRQCFWTSNTRSKMFTLHSINAFGQVTQEVFYPPLRQCFWTSNTRSKMFTLHSVNSSNLMI